LWLAAACAVTVATLVPVPARAQRGGGLPPPANARAAATFDLTGYWISAITEDWKYRMVTPTRGEYGGVPLTAAGRSVADTWDPERDLAAGEACKGYAAPGIMRVPGRLHVTWQDDNTLRIDTDAGTQTRLFRFDSPPAPGGERTWQGHSAAQWETSDAGRGNLKVVTTNLKAGSVRKNGVPYSEDAVMTEFYDIHEAPNGDAWIVITTIVEDPLNFNGPFVTSTNFKRLPDGSGWNPTPCSVD
jgi:hypothetical protein